MNGELHSGTDVRSWLEDLVHTRILHQMTGDDGTVPTEWISYWRGQHDLAMDLLGKLR